MPKVGLYNKAISEAGMESIVDLYAKCYQLTQRYGTVHIGISPAPKGFDMHLDPSDEQVAKDKTAREHQIVSAAALSGKFGGSVPGAIKRVVGDILDPKVPWQQHIRAEMTRKTGELTLDWRFMNRRLAGRDPQIFYAAPGHKGCGPIVVVGDNSGSINKQYATMFASEMTHIVNDLKPSKLIVMWCDKDITRYHELEDPEDLIELFAEWKATGIGGGGGTSFVPPFTRLKEADIKPDVLVYFTDGMGTFPTEPPPYEVIWAMTTQRNAPFGEIVRVEL
jgi:predicted metal-dependent peptidase